MWPGIELQKERIRDFKYLEIINYMHLWSSLSLSFFLHFAPHYQPIPPNLSQISLAALQIFMELELPSLFYLLFFLSFYIFFFFFFFSFSSFFWIGKELNLKWLWSTTYWISYISLHSSSHFYYHVHTQISISFLTINHSNAIINNLKIKVIHGFSGYKG